MQNMDLAPETRKEVREYFMRVQDTADKQNELEDFFQQISPSLKKSIQSEIFTKVIANNPVLKQVIESIKVDNSQHNIVD